MSEEKGKKNRYICEECEHSIITENVDSGTTPFMIRCTKVTCDGMMQSQFYRIPQHLEAGFEWYSPDNFTPKDIYREVRKELGYSNSEQKRLLKDPEELFQGIKEHLDKGGLLLRKRKTPHAGSNNLRWA